MAIIKCPECGHEISDKAPVCPSCGVPIAGHIIICSNCGNAYLSEKTECPYCHRQTLSQNVSDGSANVENELNDKEENRISEQKAEEKKSSRNNKAIIATAVVVAVIVCGICYLFYSNVRNDREMQAYEYAMSSNDPQVLQEYLGQYQDAPQAHRDSIQAHLDRFNMMDQDWTNAVVSGSRSEIEKYLQQHPDSPFKNVALHKLDSIDWVMAQKSNTVEDIERYIELHPDGDHIDDANSLIKSINAKTLQPEEKQMIVSIFENMFLGLNNRDEDMLTGVFSPLISNFLGKQNANRGDVVTYMHKIYKNDVASMNWNSSDNYIIVKNEDATGAYIYDVDFSAVQTVTHTDNTVDNVKYKMKAKVNADGRIVELNMTKIVE